MSDKQEIAINGIPEALVRERAAQCSRVVPMNLAPFIPALEERFGESMKLLLLYGSCLHTETLDEAIVDLYVVVDDYQHAYKTGFFKLLNRIVPPNVFYLEVKHGTQTLRAKYGVISIEDFENGSCHWFHSYIWGRFAQPIRILHSKDEACLDRMHRALAQSTLTFLRKSIPALGNSIVDSETIWTRALALSYNAELRPERETRASQLTHLNMGDYKRLMATASPALAELVEGLPHDRYCCVANERRCRRALRAWRLRALQGRILSLMRLVKAVFTFSDCIDYAAWKIERHTGISIEVTPKLRKYPLIYGWRVMWQLVRRGVMH